MRIFGPSRTSKTPAVRRTNAASAAEAAETHSVTDLEATDEMPIVREIGPIAARPSYPPVGAPRVFEPDAAGEDGDSDVFACRRTSPDLDSSTDAAAAAEAVTLVTLYVYGWENVEPGPLSWAFPSLRSALDAVKTMRNAVEWCIVAGAEWASIDAARAGGAVLIEQNT